MAHDNRRQMRVQRNDQDGIAAGRTQRGQDELRFVAGMPGNRKFAGANAHAVQALGIVQAQETAGETAIHSELCGHGGDMPAGALDSAS